MFEIQSGIYIRLLLNVNKTFSRWFSQIETVR